MRDNKDVFEKEVQSLKHAKNVLKQNDLSNETLWQEYERLFADYEKLLNDAKVITNISDRLQNRLNFTNDKLNEINEELNAANENLKASSDEIQRKNDLLQKTNDLLQDTIHKLIRAKIGRRAATIVLIVAVLLFLFEEAVLEPVIDQYVKDNMWISLAVKGCLALLLKPIDILVEWLLMRRTMRGNRHALNA